TCESGALVAGVTHSRIDAPASEAAVGRLHEATGRPVLTAAASGRAAFEGYGTGTEKHGVFTAALLDAFRNPAADTNNNGTVELGELVAHVQSKVPEFAARLISGAPAKRSHATARAALAPLPDPATTEPKPTTQSPRFGSLGEDFLIARRLK